MNMSLGRRERAQIFCDAGEAQLNRGGYVEARAQFEQAIVLYPLLAQAHLGLSLAFRQLGDLTEAERAARAALEAEPSYAAAAHFLGALLVELDRLPESLPFLQSAAEWAPDVALHQRDLGVAQLFLGDIEGSRQRLKRTIDLDVHAHEVLYTLIRMRPMGDGSAEAEQLLGIVRELAEQSDSLPLGERAEVLFSLGKAYEDRRDFASAAEVFHQANAVKRSALTYDVAADEARLKRIAEVFDASLLERLSHCGAESDRPVFVVGMPRSGSTLVEQILASHPDVHAAGEVFHLPQVLNACRGKDGSVFPEWAATMNQVDCRAIGQAYLDRLPTGLPGQMRTTDKWLENFEALGLISVCLPNATIIHCHRDPRDQLLSCWTLLFSQNQEYGYDVGELVRYYRAYEALMAHWRATLPAGRMLEVRYEDLVADPEPQTRRILDHCRLEWDKQVLRFWEAQRPVKSASMFQVREPIYDRSIGRWQPFADHVPELFETFLPATGSAPRPPRRSPR